MPAYRYGIVLLLLFATFVFLAIGPTGDWVPLVAVVLQGATLLAALSASGSSRRLWRIAVIVVVISLGSATVGLIVGDKTLTGSLFLLSLLLVAGAPVRDRCCPRTAARAIDIQTVLGAVVRLRPSRDVVVLCLRGCRNDPVGTLLHAAGARYGRRLSLLQLRDADDRRVR